MKEKRNSYYISKLIYSNVSESITSDEKKELEEWLKKDGNKEFYETVVSEKNVEEKILLYSKTNKEEVFSRIEKRISIKKDVKLKRRAVPSLLKYAAVIVFLVLVSKVIYNNNFDKKYITKKAVENIKPGYQRATLVLSDGSSVDLDLVDNAIIRNSETIKIENIDKTLTYSNQELVSKDEQVKFNTLHVPVGGTYKLELSDGTSVWLNSASSIRYPTKFVGDQRIVELEGEAYFDVTKRDGKEFIVRTLKSDIIVLGTQFNVSSYEEDDYFSATLVEGSVSISSKDISRLLSPGERGLLKDNSEYVDVMIVNTKKYTSWKDGKFYFNSDSLGNILKKVKRWYNIDVVFGDESIEREKFTGVVFKDKSIDYLLDLICSSANLEYKITNKNGRYELRIDNK